MLQFVREIQVSVLTQGASSSRRGFLFNVAAGFSKDINPLSGMTVNLMLVDQWLGELKSELEADVFVSSSESLSHVFAEIMAVTRLNLIEQAEKENAQLTSLEFREERGWGFAWQHHQSPEEITVKHSHFLEAFVQDPKEFGLLKVEFEWLRKANCETDFAHEGFKILKGLSAKNFEELCAFLEKSKGLKLPSGSFLANIKIHHLSRKFTLAL
ncbi:MAG: hypothetical protein J7501_07310 [Bdellovibrio sp.]|nr:hypothetical protein [Bdellovibrio sp.]